MPRKWHLVKIELRTAEVTKKGILKIKERYGSIFTEIFKGITGDNGSEFVYLTNLLSDTAIYYAHPYL